MGRTQAPVDTQPNHILGSYRSWMLPARLTEPSDMIWIHEAGKAARPERLLPFLEPSIVIRRTISPEGRYRAIELLVCAAMPDTGWHRSNPGEQLIGIRLRPELSGPQLGIWARDHQYHEPEPAGRVLRDAASAALRAAEHEPAPMVARRLLETVIAVAQAARSEWVGDAVNLIRRTRGGISCADLAGTMEVSPRHLHRSFKARFGYSAKEYARRTRFTSAMIAADAQAAPHWADIALTFGYSDQSHLNRDCRYFLDSGPARAHRDRQSMSDSSKIAAQS